MKFVYGIAFQDRSFLMVFNPKRKGWEMPGGAVEDGESDEEAMVREFKEETGLKFLPLASQVVGKGRIFAGRLAMEEGKGEMKWSFFEDLPSLLSFPEVEYRELVKWGRRQLGLE